MTTLDFLKFKQENKKISMITCYDATFARIVDQTDIDCILVLGCYVHDMRLQFLEFFGRFYEDGGKAYRPLGLHNTKYVEIIKEEQ